MPTSGTPSVWSDLSWMFTDVRGWMIYVRILVWLACVAVLCTALAQWRDLPEILFWTHGAGVMVLVFALVVFVAAPFWTGHDAVRWCLRRCRDHH